WANLVIHVAPDDTEAWRSSTAHAHAVTYSPALYKCVRIHNGQLEGGVTGNQAISINRTKYWDYAADPTWQAVRKFDVPLQRPRIRLS
ncbi:MAG: hypothetical protein WKF60_12865, partial [Ilumatobacter sp.]